MRSECVAPLTRNCRGQPVARREAGAGGHCCVRRGRGWLREHLYHHDGNLYGSAGGRRFPLAFLVPRPPRSPPVLAGAPSISGDPRERSNRRPAVFGARVPRRLPAHGCDRHRGSGGPQPRPVRAQPQLRQLRQPDAGPGHAGDGRGAGADLHARTSAAAPPPSGTGRPELSSTKRRCSPSGPTPGSSPTGRWTT